MKKDILSGISISLLLFFLFYIPGCSLIRRPSPPRPYYTLALEKLAEKEPSAAARLLLSVSPDEEIYPAALIRGLEAARGKDDDLYARFLSRLAGILPRYPFLDDYYYFALMRQQADRGDYSYLLTYRDYFDLVEEEDLYKELLFFHVKALMKAGMEEEALREAISLYPRRLPGKEREILEELIISLLQKDSLSLQGPEWSLLSRLPLRTSRVRQILSRHYEDTRFWWETASRFLSLRELTAIGGEKNGYILARRLNGSPSNDRVRNLIAGYLDDPALKYPSPLAALFLSLFPDDLRSFSFFPLLDDEASEKAAGRLFKALLEERRYDTLKKWLSAWNREEETFSNETRSRFLFWETLLNIQERGLTPEDEDRLAECSRLAPLSYYHIRAARLLGLSPLDPRLFSPSQTRNQPDPKMDSLLTALDAYDDTEGIRLIQLSIDNDHFFDNLPLFMDLYAQEHEYDWMILSARYLWKAEGPSERLLPYLYPRGFEEEIRSHSAMSAEKTPLVFAVIHQESRFSPSAVSRAGARGLMQLMPATFQGLVQAAGEADKEQDPFDIHTNIKAGTLYLRRLLGRFTEREYALAAYNAGPHRLQLWREEFGSRPPEEFVELIPFTETRNYIYRVIALEEIYRALGP